MAKITKRLCLPVGSYTAKDSDKPRIEYRDIGVVVEFEDKDGNAWQEIKLHADVLNSCLFQLARGMMDKGQSSARVKLFDVARKSTDKTAPAEADDGLGGDQPY